MHASPPSPLTLPLPLEPSSEAFRAIVVQAAAHVRGGGVVVAPTETFYGLLARADDEAAVARVLRLKGRPPAKPLPLIVADVEAARTLCHLSARMQQLAQRHWPGPLTLVLPARAAWPRACGADALALRVSAHPFVTALAAAVDAPLTATSANVSGAPPATTLEAVSLVRGPKTPWLAVDGGRSPGGLPSTLVREKGGALQLLRAGAVPWPLPP